jgi:hypothetical protein
MRIYIMISDDVIFKPSVLFRLLQRRSTDVCGVGEVAWGKTNKSNKRNRLSRIQFPGIKGLVVLGFYSRFLRILKCLPLPSFIKSRLSNRDVCSFFRVPFEHVYDVNQTSFVRSLSKLEPDIIISCQDQIFYEELLSVPKIACINCHPGKLPDYRGGWPIFWAMMHDEKTIGVTVHTMTRKIDMGAIICQKEFVTSKDRSFFDNSALAHELFPDVILESLDLIAKKDISEFPSVPADAPYYKLPTLEDVERFRAAGLKIV